MPEQQPYKHTTLNAIFDDYVAQVYTTELGGHQRREVKRAFFAGAKALLWITLRNANTLTEAQACESLGRWEKELEGFTEAVRIGAA